MLTAILLVIISVFFPQDISLYSEPEAYAVYSAIVPAEWAAGDTPGKTLVIRAETVPYKNCLVIDGPSKSTVGPAASDYDKRNVQTMLLQPKFRIDLPYTMVPAGKLQAASDSASWIELSAVGFNAAKTIAVVYMGHNCPGLCGAGTFHVLRKKDGKWQPLQWNGGSCAWAR